MTPLELVRPQGPLARRFTAGARLEALFETDLERMSDSFKTDGAGRG